MTVAFEWDINQIICAPKIGSLENVVSTVQWTVKGTTTVDSKTYTAVYRGVTRVPFDPNIGFVPYDELTKAQVLDWVWNNPDGNSVNMSLSSTIDTKTKSETLVQSRLDKEITPPQVVMSYLPW